MEREGRRCALGGGMAMAALAGVSWEVDPGSVAGTAVDRFLDEPLARGLNGETAVDRFLDEPSDRGPAGETAVDRSLDTGVGLKASAKKDEVSLPQTGPFFAGMKKAAEQTAIPLLIDLMSARGSAKKNKAVGSDGCPSEFWKYLSCVSMVVIFLLFLMRLLAMEDGRNVDSPHSPRGWAECRTYRDHRRRRPRPHPKPFGIRQR